MKAVLKSLSTPEGLMPVVLWAALWANLNTGPWQLDYLSGSKYLILFLRVYAPWGVLGLGLLIALGRRWGSVGLSPTFLLALYGALTAIACTQSPAPWWATYWAIAYLAATAVSRVVISSRDPALATGFLWITWLATVIITVGVIHAGGDAVWAGGAESYTIGRHIPVISTGVSRWGAVCALLSLAVCIYIPRWLPRIILLAITVAGSLIVYTMQSRGTLFSSVAGVFFLLLVERRTRRWSLPFLIVAMLLVWIYSTRHDVSDSVMSYLERRQSSHGGKQSLYTLTGRTSFWEEGWQAFLEAPFFGRGQWSDRLLHIGHIHNTPLQALMNGGMVGFIPYLFSWITGWRLFFRVWKRREQLSRLDQVSLLQCGSVLAFFTLRAIPETTTASYSPDLLMMLAMYVFLESAERRASVTAPVGYYLVYRRSPTQATATT